MRCVILSQYIIIKIIDSFHLTWNHKIYTCVHCKDMNRTYIIAFASMIYYGV